MQTPGVGLTSMTTTLTRATPDSKTDCLQFLYMLTGQGAVLSVSIELLNGNRTTVWASVDPTGGWTTGQIPVTAQSAYKVRHYYRPLEFNSYHLLSSLYRIYNFDAVLACFQLRKGRYADNWFLTPSQLFSYIREKCN